MLVIFIITSGMCSNVNNDVVYDDCDIKILDEIIDAKITFFETLNLVNKMENGKICIESIKYIYK